jgi:hypothetical protein
MTPSSRCWRDRRLDDEEDLIARLASDLVGSSGGYLRSTLRSPGLTCATCAGPVSGWTRCYKCGQVYGPSRWAADQMAAMVYAVGRQQSGYMMRLYKAVDRPVREHVAKVGSLLWIGLGHRGCAGAVLGVPVTHWATVPSIPARPDPHPLNRLVARHPHLQLPELPLVAAAAATSPRDFRPDNVQAPPLDPRARVAPGRHVGRRWPRAVRRSGHQEGRCPAHLATRRSPLARPERPAHRGFHPRPPRRLRIRSIALPLDRWLVPVARWLATPTRSCREACW